MFTFLEKVHLNISDSFRGIHFKKTLVFRTLSIVGVWEYLTWINCKNMFSLELGAEDIERVLLPKSVEKNKKFKVRSESANFFSVKAQAVSPSNTE